MYGTVLEKANENHVLATLPLIFTYVVETIPSSSPKIHVIFKSGEIEDRENSALPT
jgi:hypothetical protein